MRMVLALILAAAPALADPTGAAPPLTAEEFDALTLGRTMTWAEFGTVYGVEQYLPDRRVRWAAVGDDCTLGHWYAEGAAICFQYENDPEPDCWIITPSASGPGSGLVAHYTTNPPDTEPVVVEETDTPPACLGPKVGA